MHAAAEITFSASSPSFPNSCLGMPCGGKLRFPWRGWAAGSKRVAAERTRPEKKRLDTTLHLATPPCPPKLCFAGAPRGRPRLPSRR